MHPPITRSSLLGRTLAVALLPAFVVKPRSASGSRIRTMYAAAAEFVEASWGSTPRIERRLGQRELLHSACILGFAAAALPGGATWAAGFAPGTTWLQWVGVTVLAAGSYFLGTDLALAVRQLGTNLDHAGWEQAGRPDRWEFRTWSQPRRSDLVAVVATTVLLAALFIGLAMG